MPQLSQIILPVAGVLAVALMIGTKDKSSPGRPAEKPAASSVLHGYLPLPNHNELARLLPAPPGAGSAASKQDEDARLAAAALRSTARYALAQGRFDHDPSRSRSKPSPAPSEPSSAPNARPPVQAARQGSLRRQGLHLRLEAILQAAAAVRAGERHNLLARRAGEIAGQRLLSIGRERGRLDLRQRARRIEPVTSPADHGPRLRIWAKPADLRWGMGERRRCRAQARRRDFQSPAGERRVSRRP